MQRSEIEATVDSVVFKDGVRAVLTLPKGAGAQALAWMVGSTVRILVDRVEPVQAALPLAEPWRAPADPGEALRTAIENTDLPSGPQLQEALEAAAATEPYVLEREGVFVIVVGKDETPYPGAPASFKTALRADTWLRQHLEEQEGALVTEALKAFREEGAAEAKKPEDERSWDAAFDRASAKFSASLVEDNYAELSAAFAEGWEKVLD